MSRKIARITQEKKLLLANEVVEDNTKIRLDSDGRLDTNEIIEYPAELDGGRNLLKSSKSLFLTGTDFRDKTIREVVNNEYGRIEVIEEGAWNSWAWGHDRLTDKKIFSDSNSKYTLSLDVRTNRENIATIQFDIRLQPGHTNVYRSDRINIPNTNGKWERVFITMTTPNDQLERNSMLIGFNSLESVVGDVIEYRNIKLEKGSQATPWTPAPEDLGLNYPDSIQNFNSSISGNNIITPEFIEGYPFVKPVIDDSLVLWLDGSTGNNYEQTGTWKDLSGNGNDGQLINFGYTEDSGWSDGGLNFDGVDDYVRVPNVLNMDGDFTVEIWAESDVYNTARALFNTNAGVSSPWNDKGFFITNIFNPLYLYWGINDGNGYVIRDINNVSTFNNSHIVVKREGNMMYSFFNYARQNSLDISSYESFKTDNDITIARGYKGKVKVVRIYGRALSNEEILQNYRAGQCSPLLAMRGDIIG